MVDADVAWVEISAGRGGDVVSLNILSGGVCIPRDSSENGLNRRKISRMQKRVRRAKSRGGC